MAEPRIRPGLRRDGDGNAQAMAGDRNVHEQPDAHTRIGGGGTPVPADDPRDTSIDAEDEDEVATPPTEGPAAAGALPG